jgi:hypothetical protein
MFYPEVVLESILIRIRLVYTYKQDGNPSTKSTRHVNANVNTQKENQDHQNSSNEMEDKMLKRHPMPQIS